MNKYKLDSSHNQKTPSSTKPNSLFSSGKNLTKTKVTVSITPASGKIIHKRRVSSNISPHNAFMNKISD
jgi:hypothetical protein